MNKKAAIKIVLVLIIFIIIESVKFGFIKQDQVQEAINQQQFETITTQLKDLERRVSELENK